MKWLMLLVCTSVTAWGQLASSVLLGEIRDESSAVVPGAEVVATHEPTGFARSTTSNSSGSYRMEQLMPGLYRVTVGKPGFRLVRIENVRLEVNQKAGLDVVLPVSW